MVARLLQAGGMCWSFADLNGQKETGENKKVAERNKKTRENGGKEYA